MRCRTIVQSVLATLLGLLLIGSPLAAQGDTGSLTGITVTGYGTATAPAARATIVLSLAETNYGPQTTLQPGSTPGASERKSVAPAIEALVAAGLDEDQIELIIGPSVRDVGSYGGPAIALLRFTLDSPTPDRISELIDAATVGAADERLILGRAGVRYEVDDCEPLLIDAREHALADARENALRQADLMNVSLGSITGTRDVRAESDTMLYGSPLVLAACTPGADAANPYAPFNLPTFDPTAEAEVIATMGLDVSFEIEDSSDATPVSSDPTDPTAEIGADMDATPAS